MIKDHIVSSYDIDLNSLKASIARMAGMVDDEIAGAIDALLKRNSDEAHDIVQADKAVDALELKVEQDATTILALRQPVAEDLRQVLAALKISNILERVGDFAANIAKRATVLNRHSPSVKAQPTLPEMARQVRTLLQNALDAYLDEDAEKANDVWMADKHVDELYNSLFRELLTYMMEDPRVITPCAHLLFIAKNLERMGDHATNIAEIVHFTVTGQAIEEARPKSDDTSYAMVVPPASSGPDEDANDKN